MGNWSWSDLDPRKVLNPVKQVSNAVKGIKAGTANLKDASGKLTIGALRGIAAGENVIARNMGITGGRGGMSGLLDRYSPSAKAHRARAQAEYDAGAPGREMARRDAIPLMVDEPAIEEARRRMLLTQSQKSGRQSTMLSSGLGG